MNNPNTKKTITVNLCTKAGFSPYNKGGALKEYEIDPIRIVDTHSYRGGNILICRPMIDKMEFIYNFQDCPSLRKQMLPMIYANAHSLLNHGNNGVEEMNDVTIGSKAFKMRWSHEISMVVTLSPTSFAIIQIFPKKNAPFFRCEFNPAKAGPAGVARLKKFIAILFDNPYFEITWENIIVWKKSIKRLDIAVDMLGVAACDIEGQYLKKSNTKRHVYQSSNGRVETFYFALPKSTNDEAYWYDKDEEEKEDENQSPEDDTDEDDSTVKIPSFGQPKIQTPYLKTRFEYRITDTTRAIADLGNLTNHLRKFGFRAMDFDTLDDNAHYVHGIFLRYALMRTKDKALEMVPQEYQKEHSEVYDNAMVSLWNPEKIWNDGWIQQLLYLGIMSTDFAPKKKKNSKKSKCVPP